jgi:hypothetical protein
MIYLCNKQLTFLKREKNEELNLKNSLQNTLLSGNSIPLCSRITLRAEKNQSVSSVNVKNSLQDTLLSGNSPRKHAAQRQT